MYKHISRTLLLCFLLSGVVYAQHDSISAPLTKKEIRKAIPRYWGFTYGFNSSSFRDFATSPLTYTGITNYSSLYRHVQNEEKETDYGVAISSGFYRNTFNDHATSSSVRSLFMDYSRLFKVDRFSNEKIITKAGGMVNVTSNIRVNQSLQNNSLGLEVFPTLFGSVKVTRDFSRMVLKNKKFLFIKYKLKPKTRDLSLRFNVGLLNSTLRNGFVYAGQSGLLNDPELLDGYEYKVFSGFRMSSSLDHTVTLKNNNRIQISYLWDAYRTGGNLDKFEMAHHTLKLPFLFNSNSK